jgi:hypothetical protein
MEGIDTDEERDEEAVRSTEYPIDTTGLEKGSRLSAPDVERAFGVQREERGYQLALLRARDFVVRRLRDRGLHVTVVQKNVETAQRHRCLARLVQVDRANLSEESRRTLDRKLEELGRRVAADRAARREVTPLARVRSTPALSRKDEP